MRATNTDARISCTTRREPSTWVSAVKLPIQGQSDATSQTRDQTRDPVWPSAAIWCNAKTISQHGTRRRRRILMPHLRRATSAHLRTMIVQSLVLHVWLKTYACTASHPRQVGQQREIPQVTCERGYRGKVFQPWLKRPSARRARVSFMASVTALAPSSPNVLRKSISKHKPGKLRWCSHRGW